MGIQGTVLTLQGRDSPRQSHLLPTLQQTPPKPPEPPQSAEGDEAPCVSLNTGRNLLRGEKKQTNPEQNTASKKVSKRDRGGEAPAFGRRSGAAAGPRRSRGAGTTGGGLTPKFGCSSRWGIGSVPILRRCHPPAPRSHPCTRVPTPGRGTGGGTGDPGQQQGCPQGVRAQPSPARASEGAEKIHPAPRGARLEKHEPPPEALGAEQQAQKWEKNTSKPQLRAARGRSSREPAAGENHQGSPSQLNLTLRKNTPKIKKS